MKNLVAGLPALLVGLALTGLFSGPAFGSGIAVSGVSLEPGAPEGCADIQFTVSWSDSWRRATGLEKGPSYLEATNNWDAAWVFIKWRSKAGDWQPAILATKNQAPAPAGAQIDVTGDGFGAFLYRASSGYGAVNYAGIKLRWNCAANGVSPADAQEVSVQAIEMVYVPQGSFYLGSGGGEPGCFEEGGGGKSSSYQLANEEYLASRKVLYVFKTSSYLVANEEYPLLARVWGGQRTRPFLVASEGRIHIADQPGCLWAGYSIGGRGYLSEAFPKGYAAFYCMKYELTQGQYTEFLNKLTNEQAANRYIGHQGEYGQTIGGSWPNYTCTGPQQAANWFSWADGCAYAAWAGLRPMTELEYEKACRGTASPVPNEYPWGTAAISSRLTATALPADGSGLEISATDRANCVCDIQFRRPVRVGLFATAGATRFAAGASYWGIMDLAGNLWESCLTVGFLNGRAFKGSLGNGLLDAQGKAVNPDWGDQTNTDPGDPPGAGARGTAFSEDHTLARVSDRCYVAPPEQLNERTTATDRSHKCGCRAVRPAPR